MGIQVPPQNPFGPLDPAETWRMEQFSQAYVQAVASAAGCHILSWTVDDDRIDVTLARKGEWAAVRGARLDIQLKATKIRCRGPQHIKFPVDIPTYDALRATNVMVPRILVVLLMRQDVNEWTHHSEARLALRRCAYWTSLRGAPAVQNRTSRTVRLPRTQVFDAPAVHDIFTRIEAGGVP
jgi:Domain of unknown function (DUF4365)